MIRARGVHAPRSRAEATRRTLRESGLLRDDLEVLRTDEGVVFPVADDDLDARLVDAGVAEGADDWEFRSRPARPRSYTELLDWEEKDLARAPRAFDAMGDIAVLKVPEALWARREALGRALLAFQTGSRAVFHDHGVQGERRTRRLERIAGEGGSETQVTENGVRLRIDPAAAYYSPRLGAERARLVGLLRRGERVIDLFAGVAPFGVQAAKAGCSVVCVDINPDACALAEANAAANKVDLEVHCGDARDVAPRLAPADHVVTNLPHGAREFLEVSVPLVCPGGTLHHHEILADDDLDARCRALVDVLADLGREANVTATRHVRNYSASESHYAIDLEVA